MLILHEIRLDIAFQIFIAIIPDFYHLVS